MVYPMNRSTGQTALQPDQIVPVQPVRLFTQVVDQLLTLIEGGELSPGDRLPAERALAQRLAVSRASVRQALTALEVCGVVQVRAGSGVYVSESSRRASGAAASVIEAAAPLEILESRALFEPGVTGLAARRRTEANLQEMQSLVEAMGDELARGSEGWESDWGFHEALGRATQNPSIQRISGELREQMGQPVWALMRARNLGRSDRARNYLNDHLDILNAVSESDAAKSETLMARHINHVITDLNKSGLNF
jgi:GntR family transcriptional regulator, transcriptional repressor for pyruvate dehydrogenase complex